MVEVKKVGDPHVTPKTTSKLTRLPYDNLTDGVERNSIS